MFHYGLITVAPERRDCFNMVWFPKCSLTLNSFTYFLYFILLAKDLENIMRATPSPNEVIWYSRKVSLVLDAHRLDKAAFSVKPSKRQLVWLLVLLVMSKTFNSPLVVGIAMHRFWDELRCCNDSRGGFLMTGSPWWPDVASRKRGMPDRRPPHTDGPLVN